MKLKIWHFKQLLKLLIQKTLKYDINRILDLLDDSYQSLEDIQEGIYTHNTLEDIILIIGEIYTTLEKIFK